MNVLDKNDSPPVFRDEPILFTVSEDLSPGHTVGTIKANDPDTIGTLSYALIAGDDKKFILDKNSGILKLIDTLDRETKDLYKLTVRVSDGVQNTDTIVSIQVNNYRIVCFLLSLFFFYFAPRSINTFIKLKTKMFLNEVGKSLFDSNQSKCLITFEEINVIWSMDLFDFCRFSLSLSLFPYRILINANHKTHLQISQKLLIYAFRTQTNTKWQTNRMKEFVIKKMYECICVPKKKTLLFHTRID